MFGLCLKFDGRHVGKMVAYGRKAQLSFVGIYNETDSRAGWYQYYSGFTLFYSHPYEDTLDPLQSIAVRPGVVPVVSFRQVHEKKLGLPYSQCVHDDQHNLRRMSQNTRMLPTRRYVGFTVKLLPTGILTTLIIPSYANFTYAHSTYTNFVN